MYRKPIGNPQRFLTKRLHRQWLSFWATYRVWLVTGSIAMFFVIGVWYVAHSIIYGDHYIVQDIHITHTQSSIESQKEIEDHIRESLAIGDSYLALRRRQRDGKETKIRHDFPLIEDVSLTSFVDQVLTIDVSYYAPRIVRHLPNGTEFGSYDEYLYPLSSGYVMSDDVALLYLPGYLAGLRSLDGIYHLNTEEQLANLYHVVNTKIPLKHMIVYPWARYVAMMTVDNLKVLFSLRKPIEEQMKLYSDIYQFYPEAHRIRQIDIGSLDDAIVTLE